MSIATCQRCGGALLAQDAPTCTLCQEQSDALWWLLYRLPSVQVRSDELRAQLDAMRDRDVEVIGSPIKGTTGDAPWIVIPGKDRT